MWHGEHKRRYAALIIVLLILTKLARATSGDARIDGPMNEDETLHNIEETVELTDMPLSSPTEKPPREQTPTYGYANNYG